MEAELFGYARGAFSGAVQAYDGQLAAAEAGTVFLDEIDDTPLSMQAKLLRVLEDRMITRLGDNRLRKVDFRFVAATNRELGELMDRGAFMRDLYERLAILAINLPPLRERLDDLEPLALHLIGRFYAEEPEARARGAVKAVSPRALEALAAYRWPGNIRELRNTIFQALVGKRAGDELLVSDLPPRILARPAAPPVDDGVAARVAAGGFNLRREVEALERAAVSAALAHARGNAARAAALLGEVGRGSARDPGGTVRAMARRLGVRRQ
jgi:transcriptional regulator with PAS, ATPase and Fis domain